MRDYDVVVVGGGPVGTALGLALGGAGIATALVDAAPRPTGPGTSSDHRPIALAYGSARILATLGPWVELAARATPIAEVHVSDRGHFGLTRITAGDCGVPALGYVVQARDLGESLAGALRHRGAVDVFRASRVDAVTVSPDAIELAVNGAGGAADGESAQFRARLLVAADGARSSLRQRFGIAVRDRDYGQMAVAAKVKPARHHGQVAYERFTEQGPIALLPMGDGHCGLVWTLPNDRAKRVMGLADDAFLRQLQARFGSRLGSFERVSDRRAYTLRLTRALEQASGRLVLLGNAAHHLHPVAGQGLNLGLRDAATLAELVVDAVARGEDPGDAGLTALYARSRVADQRAVTAATDALVRVFGIVVPPVPMVRGAALLVLDALPGLKRALAARAMGLAGRQSRLARGIAL